MPYSRIFWKIIWSSILLAVMGSSLLLFYAYRSLTTPIGQAQNYYLQAGTSMRRFAQDLQQMELMQSTWPLLCYARLVEADSRLQVGEYQFPAESNLIAVLHQVQRGDVVLHRLTIPEGWTFKQLRAALAADPVLAQTINPQDSAAVIMQNLGYPEQHPEGQFYPDTYLFARGTRDIDFLQRAYQSMQQHLAREWPQRAASTAANLATPYAALILASIIEKETGILAEQPLIAAVFHNRLRLGMRLQTDPTVIYGLGDAYDGDIKFRDLRTDTPYNTYTRHGLPPTPIALPGLSAIHAALNPADDTEVLYFVAVGDGSHKFSYTLAEHEAAVDLYQRRR